MMNFPVKDLQKTRLMKITPDIFLATSLWVISILFFLIGDAGRGPIIVWSTIIPFGIFLYWYSFHSLIPASLKRKRAFLRYLWKVIIVLTLAELPLLLLTFLLSRDEDLPFIITTVNILFQLFITAPFSWLYFKRSKRGAEVVASLQKELGRSTANFDFLRSQINPHFLFNILNTIYGTAIEERAERTSEAILQLSDMMRFMLRENMQEKIPLMREIDYLNNYINLQKIRTDAVPGIRIQVDIAPQTAPVTIAPMLLIPFVENAFKHGISFREPSYISLSLETTENTLHFDISNSRNIAPENDPETDKSGIGLVNVKERLQLLYPGRHTLYIRETAKDFFVHLTVQLS